MGRRKVEIKFVKSRDARYVTFSKRRNGLFKKACELSILCNARIGLVGFTPGGKPFAFGSPTFQVVTNKYLHEGQGESSNQNVDNSENENFNNLKEELKGVRNELKEVRVANDQEGETTVSIAYDDLDLEELQKVKAKLKQLHGDIEAASSLLILAKTLPM